MSAPTEAPAGRNWKHWTEPIFVEVDGRTVAYRRKGSGVPLLYLHGAGLTRNWLPFYDKLSETYDVIVPEHPGFGDSPVSESIDSFQDLVLHYDAFIRALGLEKPHLVGHSMGGWLAADMAVHYPTRFASLTLMSPIGMRTPGVSPGDPFRWGPEEAAEKLVNGYGAEYAEFFEQDGGVDDTIREYGESITFARLTWNPRYDVRFESRLARVEIPSSVIHFEADGYVPVEVSRAFANSIPNAQFHLFGGTPEESASHVAIIQHPDALAGVIKGVLGN